jgi:hypothetical protein
MSWMVNSAMAEAEFIEQLRRELPRLLRERPEVRLVRDDALQPRRRSGISGKPNPHAPPVWDPPTT